MIRLDPEFAYVGVRLAETIAWCKNRTSLANPRESLRSPVLRPSNLRTTPDKWGHLDFDWKTPDENRAVVDHVAQRRAQLLQAGGDYNDVLPVDLGGGRLLIAAPEESDSCGLSEDETKGFFDVCDVPAWDTWVCYMHEATFPDPEEVLRTQQRYRFWWNRDNRKDFVDWQPPESLSYILCWVPAELVAMVEDGIRVNPVECIVWAADYKRHHYNTRLMQQLDSAGILI